MIHEDLVQHGVHLHFELIQWNTLSLCELTFRCGYSILQPTPIGSIPYASLPFSNRGVRNDRFSNLARTFGQQCQYQLKSFS